MEDRSILEAALLGYEARRQEIDRAITEIRAQLGQCGNVRPIDGATPRKRRNMSAAARARIAAAQRKRWAEHRRKTGQPQPNGKKTWAELRRAAAGD